jgi:GxxExxY protein
VLVQFRSVEIQASLASREKTILELKALSELADECRAQVQNYLKATRVKLGLLVNFGHYPKLQIERLVAERGRYGSGR